MLPPRPASPSTTIWLLRTLLIPEQSATKPGVVSGPGRSGVMQFRDGMKMIVVVARSDGIPLYPADAGLEVVKCDLD